MALLEAILMFQIFVFVIPNINGRNLTNTSSQRQIAPGCIPYYVAVTDGDSYLRFKSNISNGNTISCKVIIHPEEVENCINGNIIIISPTKQRKNDHIYLECWSAVPVDFDYDGIVPYRFINIEYKRLGSGFRHKREFAEIYMVKLFFLPIIDASGKYTFFSLLDRDLKVDIHLRIKMKFNYGGPILFNEGDTLTAKKDNNYLIIPCRAFDREMSLTLAKVSNVKLEEKILNDKEVKFDPEVGFILDISNRSDLLAEEYICWITNSTVTQRRNNFVRFKTEFQTGNYSRVVGSGPTVYFKQWNNNILKLNPNAYCNSKDTKSTIFVNVFSYQRTTSLLKTNCVFGLKDYNCDLKKDSAGDWTGSKFKVISQVWPSGLLICTSSNISRTVIEYFVGFDKNISTELRPRNISPEKIFKIELFPMLNERFHFRPVENFFSRKDYRIFVYFIDYIFMYYSLPICYFKNAENQTFGNIIVKGNPIHNVLEGSKHWNFTVNFPSSKVKVVTCSISFWNYGLRKLDEMNITKTVNITDAIKPTVQIENTIPIFTLSDIGRSLSCKSNGYPVPEMNWTIHDNSIPAIMNITELVSNGLISLSFPIISKLHEANYTCSATNEFGTFRKTIYLRVVEKGTSFSYGLIGLPIVISVLLLGAAIITFYYSQNRKKGMFMSQEEIDSFFFGDASSNVSKINDDLEYIPNIPYDNEYEIQAEDYSYDKEDILGSGHFGIVYKGMVNNQQVAVKTVSKFATKDHVRALLSELKLMIYIGEHPHIPTLIGAHTQSISKGLVFMFVELCSLGSLEKYLRRHRTHFITTENEKLYCNTQGGADSEILTVSDFINWSIQTANAMTFLSSKNVIHGDLATRNILLCNKTWLKVTDFGLSRKLYEYTNYVKTSQEPLPWRWLALESLKDMQFSSKTDVWAFGVTAWEIFTLGEVPYGGISWNLDFPNKLKQGLRLLKPENATDEIYEILQKCWCNEDKERPTFAQLSEFFQSLCSPFSAAMYTELNVSKTDLSS